MVVTQIELTIESIPMSIMFTCPISDTFLSLSLYIIYRRNIFVIIYIYIYMFLLPGLLGRSIPEFIAKKMS